MAKRNDEPTLRVQMSRAAVRGLYDKATLDEEVDAAFSSVTRPHEIEDFGEAQAV